MRLFVFQNQTTLLEPIKVKNVEYGLQFDVNDNTCTVDYKHMKEGDSAIVIYSPLASKVFTLYNYRELLQIWGIAPSQTYSCINAIILGQVDIVQGEPFVKVFLSNEQFQLDGNLDTSDKVFKTTNGMSALDIAFSYDTHTTYKIANDKIFFTVTLSRNAYTLPIYFNYGSSSCELDDDVTHIMYDYIPGEDAFIGPERSRLEGRRVRIIER